MKKEFRIVLDEADYLKVQNIKEENKIKTNAELFKYLLEQQKFVAEFLSELPQTMKTIEKQIRFTKEQIGILNEMQSEYLDGEGMRAVGYGIEAPIYESAKKLLHERIHDQMEKNNGMVL